MSNGNEVNKKPPKVFSDEKHTSVSRQHYDPEKYPAEYQVFLRKCGALI